ncbi:MAG TPA: hypothetical protein VNK82_02040 [Terriglobales bacterium]|nr:hypothetical protein [Terriglobales bacterium]
MPGPGAKLRRIRQRLGLTMREVEAASRLVAKRRKSTRYLVLASRLSDIENYNSVPTIYRLYSLAVIYSQSLPRLLSWYGVAPAQVAADRRWVASKR